MAQRTDGPENGHLTSGPGTYLNAFKHMSLVVRKPVFCIFCGCTDRFVSDLVGNPEDRFSHKEAHIRFIVQGQGKTTPCVPSYVMSA